MRLNVLTAHSTTVIRLNGTPVSSASSDCLLKLATPMRVLTFKIAQYPCFSLPNAIHFHSSQKAIKRKLIHNEENIPRFTFANINVHFYGSTCVLLKEFLLFFSVVLMEGNTWSSSSSWSDAQKIRDYKLLS
jgi:hypothetical protein